MTLLVLCLMRKYNSLYKIIIKLINLVKANANSSFTFIPINMKINSFFIPINNKDLITSTLIKNSVTVRLAMTLH